ncbi:hypothetical protein ATANTOWER_020492 [Ataeniobius toweri]|uniref:LIM zinc-binding domain-containing protein n=1 Tax=Ataeniobius toweri TaxID=208326 RepID=A0ABU7B3A2_9TELE|nr:hypothetical protein [Ataeniobius toweri]
MTLKVTVSVSDHQNWHKGCFHCEVCKMTLNMKNYKGYDKKPYCNAHYPKTSFTIVTDTPENLRLRQQSELQSQVKYKKDFEESKGRGFSPVSDTREMQRLRRTQEQISNLMRLFEEELLLPLTVCMQTDAQLVTPEDLLTLR